MFEIFFGWIKASKCKKLVKRVRCRLRLLKNKRSTIARLVREDVAQLISAGHEEIAFGRMEQLCNDLSLVSAYELLDHFCEFILVHLSYIWRNKDIPNDINEAISSLIFASARCGDVPELIRLRKLFAERNGQRFATTAVELSPGNFVNHQIKEKLSGKPVLNDAKQNLFDEIARDGGVKSDLLAFEFASEHEKQEKEKMSEDALNRYLLTYYNETESCKTQEPSYEKTEVSTLSSQTSRQNSGTTSISVSSSIVRQSSPEAEEIQSCADKVTKQQSREIDISCFTSSLSSSSSESLDQFREEDNIMYLDDGVEEFESPQAKAGDEQDQRLFMFKSIGKGRWIRLTQSAEQVFHCRAVCTSTGFDNFSHGSSENSKTETPDQTTITRQDHGSATIYNVFTYPDPESENRTGNLGDFGSSKVKEMSAPPYRRAATMGQERAKESLRGSIERSNSCPNKNPSHVHPKLPDYDDIAAKFLALKKERLKNKVSVSEIKQD